MADVSLVKDSNGKVILSVKDSPDYLKDLGRERQDAAIQRMAGNFDGASHNRHPHEHADSHQDTELDSSSEKELLPTRLAASNSHRRDSVSPKPVHQFKDHESALRFKQRLRGKKLKRSGFKGPVSYNMLARKEGQRGRAMRGTDGSGDERPLKRQRV